MCLPTCLCCQTLRLHLTTPSFPYHPTLLPGTPSSSQIPWWVWTNSPLLLIWTTLLMLSWSLMFLNRLDLYFPSEPWLSGHQKWLVAIFTSIWSSHFLPLQHTNYSTAKQNWPSCFFPFSNTLGQHFSPFIMQEVLPVLMKWRQFPSPWLSCSDSEKKLASIWKPCLSNQCTTDLLPPPAELPPMLSGVQTDDYVDNKGYAFIPRVKYAVTRAEFSRAQWNLWIKTLNLSVRTLLL